MPGNGRYIGSGIILTPAGKSSNRRFIMNGRNDNTEKKQDVKLNGMAAILEEENTKTLQQEKAAVQTEAAPENSAGEEDNMLLEGASIITKPAGKESNHQPITRREQAVDLFAVAFLVVGLLALSCYAFRMIWKLYALAMNLYGVGF